MASLPFPFSFLSFSSYLPFLLISLFFLSLSLSHSLARSTFLFFHSSPSPCLPPSFLLSLSPFLPFTLPPFSISHSPSILSYSSIPVSVSFSHSLTFKHLLRVCTISQFSRFDLNCYMHLEMFYYVLSPHDCVLHVCNSSSFTLYGPLSSFFVHLIHCLYCG